MSIELFIYLAGLVGGLRALVVASATIGAAILAMFFFICWVESRELPKYKWHFAVLFALAVIGVAIPSERTMWMIAGAHVAKEAVETETGKKVMELVNAKLDEALKEVTK